MNFAKTDNSLFTLFLLCFLLAHFCCYSQQGTTVAYAVNPSLQGKTQFVRKPFQNKVFIEEQGQFKHRLEKINITISEPILFAVNSADFNAYFTKKGITFLFSKMENRNPEEDEEEEEKEVRKGKRKEKSLAKWETVSMQWENPNSSVLLVSEEKVNEYYTFDKSPDGKEYNHVAAYKKIRYVNLFDGVDAEFEMPEKGGIKYQFIVHAGNKIPTIAYRMVGTKKMFLDKEGNLHIKSALNDIIDKAPNAFMGNQEIPTIYSLKGNCISINTSSITTVLNNDLIIDPWIVDPVMPNLDNGYDIQEDLAGNVYVLGGNHYNYQIQKYTAAGTLLWTFDDINPYYAGDIAVSNSGTVYYSGGYSNSQIRKLNTGGAVILTGPTGEEYWRFSFNRSKTILALGGNFFSTSNSLARLDTVSLAIVNQLGYSPDVFAMTTDCNGDIYSLGTYGTYTLRKTNADFTPGGSVFSGSGVQQSGNLYAAWAGTNSIIVNGPYAYIFDGADLRRFDKNTLTFVNMVTVPNGLFENCSGLAFDYCGNIYVGTMSTIEKYDLALNHVASIPAPNSVYDILLAGNGDLLVCGKAFVANMGPTCSAPPQLTSTISSTAVSCNPGTASVTATGGTLPYTYSWLPGGQTTSTINNLTAGTYKCIINDAFCQSNIDSVFVSQVSPLAISVGSITPETCLNNSDGSASVVVSGGSAPYSFSWNTNPVQTDSIATGLSAGTYTATVTDGNTCTSTVAVTVTSNPNPIANFVETSVCNGNNTVFTDSSKTATGSISSWKWDFGDTSNVSLIQSPTHLYTNAGIHVVTLIVNNTFGCADTVTKNAKVFFNPTASFTHSDVCLKDSVHFVNTSSVDTSSSVASFHWLFDDGSSSFIENPVHLYANAGTYHVTLLIKTVDSCSDAITMDVNVFDPPTAQFSVNNVCLFDSANIINTSITPTMGTISNWLWSFGDGTPVNTSALSPHHLYAVPGVYTIQLITYSSNLGCADTLVDTVHVFPMPTAAFSVLDVCVGQITNFVDLSVVANPDIIAGWNWDFGAGLTAGTVQNPNVTFLNQGAYSVTLIVSTNHGCKDTVIHTTIIHPKPTSAFITHNVCLGSVASFVNASVIPSNPSNDVIASWSWFWGDNTLVNNNQSPTHVYASIGTDTVLLKVISDFGCVDSIEKVITVNPNPEVHFTSNDSIGCEPLCVNFQNQSLIASGTNVSFSWNFGDNSTLGNGSFVNHCYNNDSILVPNYFTITLTVVSDSGCVNSETKQNYITVYPLPYANFEANPLSETIANPVISVHDLSIGASTWTWNWGGGDTNIVMQHPLEHTYADTGVYTITLLTSNQYNCKDSTYHSVIIEPDFIFYIPNSFSPNGDELNDTFMGTGLFVKELEMSIFDRWGNLIYQTNSMDKPWDGKANKGIEPAQKDVYVYLIKVTDFKLGKHVYRGTVTLAK